MSGSAASPGPAPHRGVRAVASAVVVAVLDAVMPPQCLCCGSAEASAFCAACDELIVRRPTGFLFLEPLAGAIRRAKYEHDLGTALGLARAWAAHARGGVDVDVDAITFVPTPWQRRVWRGFDFPALLAQALGRELGVPVVRAVDVVRHDAPMAGDANRAERAARVHGRYRAARAAQALAGKRVVLVDDVRTTGATLAAVHDVLVDAGVVVVDVALADTPFGVADDAGAPGA